MDLPRGRAVARQLRREERQEGKELDRNPAVKGAV